MAIRSAEFRAYVPPGVAARQEEQARRVPLNGDVVLESIKTGSKGPIARIRLSRDFASPGRAVETSNNGEHAVAGGSSVEDQVSRGGAEEKPILPDGYSVGPWDQGLVGPGLWVAETTVGTPEGGIQRTVFSSAGGLQKEPLNP